MQILFALCPMPLPLNLLVSVCFSFCYYLVKFDVLSSLVVKGLNWGDLPVNP